MVFSSLVTFYHRRQRSLPSYTQPALLVPWHRLLFVNSVDNNSHIYGINVLDTSIDVLSLKCIDTRLAFQKFPHLPRSTIVPFVFLLSFIENHVVTKTLVMQLNVIKVYQSILVSLFNAQLILPNFTNFRVSMVKPAIVSSFVITVVCYLVKRSDQKPHQSIFSIVG